MNYKNIPLGALQSPKDERDWHITKLVPMLSSFPEEFVIPYNHPIKNQGFVGSCVAHALTYCREIIEEKQLGKYIQLSPGFVYADRLASDYQGSGMYVRDALNELVSEGICDYDSFPINKEYPDILNDFNPIKSKLLINAAPHKISSYASVCTTDEIKTALMQLGPVALEIGVYSSFYKISNVNPILSIPNYSTETYFGNHGMTIIGWRKDNTWIVLNQWGQDWGDNGKCYIPFNFEFIEAWSITDNIVPTPPVTKYYRVQTGAFGVKSNADNFASYLKSLGFNTYVVYLNNLYKVQLGAFSVKDNAQKLSDQLTSQGINNFIVYY